MILQASQVRQWVTSDAAYQEMRSGGELGLISDQALRDAMSQYYLENGSASAYLFDMQPEYRKIVRGLTPSSVDPGRSRGGYPAEACASNKVMMRLSNLMRIFQCAPQ